MDKKSASLNPAHTWTWLLLRLVMSFILLWAFFDKLLGLGFATPSDKSWIKGLSPTFGFLKFGLKGFFAPFFQNLAGNMLVDILFMMGLLFIGLALFLGIGIRIAGITGALLMFLMWLSLFPPQNNPLIDEHIVYMIIFIGFASLEHNSQFGLSNWWKNTTVVKKYPFLR